MKNKLTLFLLPLFLTSCGPKKDHFIYMQYVENPAIVDITIDDLQNKFDNLVNDVVYVTFKGLVDCGCSNSESVLIDYLPSHNFNMSRIMMEQNSETFIEDYNHLVDITKRDAEEFALPDLIINDDSSYTIPVYPRMMIISQGYIVVNTDKDFKKTLDKYVRTSEI